MAEISGTVELDDGTAIEGATVIASNVLAPNPDVITTTTDTNGDFTLDVGGGYDYHVMCQYEDEDGQYHSYSYPYIFVESDDPLVSIRDHHWPASEGSGTTLEDDVGTLNGAISGATWDTSGGRGGSYLTFDGSDDIVDYGAASQSELNHFLAGDGTVGFWFRVDTVSTGDHQYLYGGRISASNSSMAIYQDGDTNDIETRISFGDGNPPFVNFLATGAISEGDWTSFALTVDSASEEAEMFINGTSANTQSFTAADAGGGDYSHNIVLGYDVGGSRYLDGALDDIWTSTTATDAQTISDWHDATSANYT